ncbi:VMAP-C domain-containing protein [Lentzea sokolovensis]|uniref:VMAP-C domain-containing protein n=1 Tax=Lentzea sokolovensis TaxID=3095429 RepID=UPI003872A983
MRAEYPNHCCPAKSSLSTWTSGRGRPKFERRPKLVSLVLSESPQVAKSGRDEVAVGLRAGVPLMVWHREKCDSAEFVAVVEELLHGVDDPHHLLERIRLARATAFEEGAAARHVCGKLTVLFDDPARVVMPVPPAAPEGVPVAQV